MASPPNPDIGVRDELRARADALHPDRCSPDELHRRRRCHQHPPQLQAFVDDVAEGRVRVDVDRVFRLDEDAHRYMEASRARG
ncbi:MAG TPA: hypothetical protein ENK57_13105 [Polyangiaceae bacterium]|nr:hypothetical protein [Polyangiaceae bacterium]